MLPGRLILFSTGYHLPSHSGHLVGKHDGGELRGFAGDQVLQPRPACFALSSPLVDDSCRTDDENRPHPFISCAGDDTEVVLSGGRVVLRREPHPRGEVTPGAKAFRNAGLGTGHDADDESGTRRLRKPLAHLAAAVCLV